MHGDPLMEVTSLMPQDVVLLHDSLLSLHSKLSTKGRNKTATLHSTLYTLNLSNAGTAFRFLTAYCAQLVGCEVVLDGCERMHQRPIGPMVEALRTMGADIEYVGQEGFPPLHIRGRQLNKQPQCVDTTISSQFASALELIGVPCDAPASPYLTMTRTLIQNYQSAISNQQLEADWSSAAFWYEYVALYGGEITLPNLSLDSIQGDRVVATLFEPLGVHTESTPTGITLHSTLSTTLHSQLYTLNFSLCPDLYPAVAVTCRQLGVDLHATGIESLAYKESNRIETVQALLATPKGQRVTTAHDHRIAMAAMVAGYAVDDEQCIDKSYPQFTEQLCKLLSHAKA
ncbi:MAG: hypothetical protein MJZ58_04105 [Paludibacteraceae bacterium]|nr:hypothetical protein [Paludibacteraceae bacterium]